MAYNLSVTEAFTIRGTDGKPMKYAKGMIITDQAQVTAILASAQAHHVVKVKALTPMPEPARRVPFKGSN